jgi:hypothetical protein
MTWLMLLLGREGRIKDQRVCHALVCAAFHLMHVSSMNFIIAGPIVLFGVLVDSNGLCFLAT